MRAFSPALTFPLLGVRFLFALREGGAFALALFHLSLLLF